MSNFIPTFSAKRVTCTAAVPQNIFPAFGCGKVKVVNATADDIQVGDPVNYLTDYFILGAGTEYELELGTPRFDNFNAAFVITATASGTVICLWH